MGLRVSYIGEALAAAGFALAGARVHVAGTDATMLQALLSRCRADSDLVIINQRHAELLGTHLEDELQREPLPPVLVVPAMETDESLRRDSLADARRVLGLGPPS